MINLENITIEDYIINYINDNVPYSITVTPTYIKIIMTNDGDVIIHYNKQLIICDGVKFSGEYNLSVIYDVISKIAPIYYYNNGYSIIQNNPTNLEKSLRDSRIDLLF